MIYRASNIELNHGFFDSEGGVSAGKYASLNTNVNSRDQADNVMRNMDIVAGRFAMQRKNMVSVLQSVSNVAVFFDSPSWLEVKADGMVTTNPDLLLGIKTADCAPVLLADPHNRVIGAAHAGWRGALKGVVENVLSLMLEHGADVHHIAAAIGPCLQQKSFAAKEDMRQIFMAVDHLNAKYFLPNDVNSYQFDLSGYLEDKINSLGIDNVSRLNLDTYPPENHFFSYRWHTHQNLIQTPLDYPTQYSCITLKE